MTDQEIVIVSTARTPIGRFGGSLSGTNAVDIGAAAIRGAVDRAGIDPGEVSEAIVGHARQANNGPNPGRLMAIGAGIPDRVPALTTQQACLSSLTAARPSSQAESAGVFAHASVVSLQVSAVQPMASLQSGATPA